ncbi:hypothetical protein COCCU_12935 [Corynebacterium occultum]|uniref:Spore protein YkvP/CgeB glycosyl transferase-like domain-containing protein n=1 Tax=Corynebacterium occultum TaxID=2675219 RepID=A0A6B8WC86_9CORY|nr:glycosyltransferase [Corynebacterium occultum]QGU08486.1 hypothetical protein COCCU_12935 [Corynebacterium occultum]
MGLSSSLQQARTGFWHLRKGGPAQLRTWLTRRRIDGAGTRASLRPGVEWNPLDIPEYVPNDRPRRFGDVRVAVILDNFSLAAWDYEFDTVPVTPGNWRDRIDDSIDLLLVESAWNGVGGAWQYQLTGSKAPSTALVDLVGHCRGKDIPTVFWNKEDPPHFEDFLDTAKLFDVVFTTDINKVPEYRKELGHENIHVMSFAAQPAIHNPIRIKSMHQRGDIAFAGTYFAHKFPERREQMDLLLNAAAEVSPRMEHGLTIFSRFIGTDEKYQFPAPVDRYVAGSLPYEKMLSAYRDFKVFLNVNSVIDSPSMCARRIFEITASGTPVVSAPSAAIEQFFPIDEIPTVTDPQETQWMLRSLVNSPRLRDRMVHRAQRRIWGNHTYTHRAQQILDAVGLETSAQERPRVSVLVSTNRPHQLEHVLDQVAAQLDVDIELLLLGHGFEFDTTQVESACSERGIETVRCLTAPSSHSLGTCLNQLVAESTGDILAKFDDDDLYGPHYLLDQVNALFYSGADLVGKAAAFAYLESSGTLLLRRPDLEHRWTDFVCGPTLVGRRETFEAVPFADRTRGEDSRFLEEVLESGRRIYAADRFNFIQVRGHGTHTWDAVDTEFLANGVVESFGCNTEHVNI